ncbi:M48 family metallopeptidase, partial [Ferruginibacter sp. HRS2-29]
MKICFVCIAVFLFLSTAFAQPGKKVKPKEKPPTQKEMEDLLKLAQDAMKDISPEDKKLMDSMGIKIPTFSNMPNVSDQQLADAYTQDGSGVVVPAKKTALIAQIPKTIFSTAQLEAYVQSTNASIADMIKPEAKQLAEKILLQFKNDPYPGAMVAASANGLWLLGYQEPAVYLMGKAIQLLPNADNYSNYAAYLTMMGAAHMAIPILQKLNNVHKKNSTIYNNLAQAWLQMGDGDKAEKYIDSAIMIYAYHPQANFTKCLLQEARGEMTNAVISLKRSIKHSATKKKLDKLQAMEKDKKQLKYYVPRVYYSTAFNLAKYAALVPKSYAHVVDPGIYNQWANFRTIMANEIAVVTADIARATAKANEEAHYLTVNTAKAGGLQFSPWYSKQLKR